MFYSCISFLQKNELEKKMFELLHDFRGITLVSDFIEHDETEIKKKHVHFLIHCNRKYDIKLIFKVFDFECFTKQVESMSYWQEVVISNGIS